MHWISPKSRPALAQLSPHTPVPGLYKRLSSGRSTILHLWLATMASPAALAFNRHVIPLISKFPENDESSYTSLTRVVLLGGDNTEKRKCNVPIVSTSDVETLCRNILEFQDVSAGARLSLTTGPLKFTYYRQTLQGTKRDKWDTIASVQPQTVLGFQAAIDAFINESIQPTDLADEQHYLQMCRKPHRLTCATLSARIEYLNKLLSVFPGDGGNCEYLPCSLGIKAKGP